MEEIKLGIDLSHLLYTVGGMLVTGIVMLAGLWWGIQKQITALREAMNQKMDGRNRHIHEKMDSMKDDLSANISEESTKVHTRMNRIEDEFKEDLHRVEDNAKDELRHQVGRFDNVLPLIHGGQK